MDGSFQKIPKRDCSVGKEEVNVRTHVQSKARNSEQVKYGCKDYCLNEFSFDKNWPLSSSEDELLTDPTICNGVEIKEPNY